jgi:hypothetical protein
VRFVVLLSTLATLSSGSTFAGNSNPIVLAQNSVAPLVSGQRVRVRKLTRDMTGVRKDLVTTGPSAFQDPAIVQARVERLNQFKQAVLKYPQVDDPDVKAARAEFGALQQALDQEYKRAQQQLKQIGDVQQALKNLDQNVRKYPVPKPLTIPFDEASAKNWIEAASNARTVGEHNQKQLTIIAELAYLPKNRGTVSTGAPYDQDDVRSMLRYAQESQVAVQNNYKITAERLQGLMQQMEQDVFTRWRDDPKGERKWIYLQQDSAVEIAEVLKKSRAIANSSIYLEKALKRKPQLAEQTLAKLDELEQRFQQNRKIALQSSRLPQAKSKDSARIEIARQILKTPKYEFGEFGPIVLTTDSIVEREKESSEVEYDKAELTISGDIKLSGTETTWTYKWQEFKFATPLKHDDGQWYIWWITAKKFSSGGNNTPLGRWVSGKASQGNPILRSNF